MELERERPLQRERQQELQLLRKKNAELALQTKRLEEKVKNLEKVRLISFHNFRVLVSTTDMDFNAFVVVPIPDFSVTNSWFITLSLRSYSLTGSGVKS